MLNTCYTAIYYFKHHGFQHPFVALFFYINLAWIFAIALMRPYKVSRTSSYLKVLKSTTTLILIHLLLIFAFYVFQQERLYSRSFLLYFYLLFSFLFILHQTLFFITIKWARRNGFNYRNLIIIANKSRINYFKKHFQSHPEYGYAVKVTFEIESINIENFEQILIQNTKEHDIHEIFYSLSNSKNDLLTTLMNFAEVNLIKVRLIADFNGIAFGGIELDNYGVLPVIKVLTTPLDEWDKQLIKRIFDIGFSIIVIVLILSWLLPILAILIKIDSKGPVFFKQQRTGRDNKPFWCYKLRSMKVNTKSDTHQAVKGDERITYVGKFLRKTSLDELPQFYNSLKGEMSVVGPRPHMIKHTKDFTNEIDNFMLRHHIKPGITGLAQAKGYRGEISDKKLLLNRVKFDLFYIKNWTFTFDIQIIFSTLISLVKK